MTQGTPIDRESVEWLAKLLADDAEQQNWQPCEMTGLLPDDEHTIADTLLALRAALDEAEAERHRWRQAASIGSIHTQADLDRAAQEARAVALQEAAEVAAYEADFVPVKPDDFRKAILALMDTPAAEALERVRAEERKECAKVAETAPVGDTLSPTIRIAAAIRARGET